MVNQGDCAGHEELGLAREGMFFPNTHGIISRKIIKLLRAKKITSMLTGEWKTVNFFLGCRCGRIKLNGFFDTIQQQ